jgi:hypothetical protein
MATFLGNGVQLSVATVDLSSYVKSVTLNQTFDTLDVTAMGSSGHSQIAGLENSSVTIEFMADFATSKVNQTINGSGAGNGSVGGTVALKVVPAAGSVSASNPLYTATCLVIEWPQVYNVTELATISVTWPVNGGITKAITGTFA